MPSWQRAKDLPELAPLFPPPPAAPPPVNAYPAAEPKIEPRGAAAIATPAPQDTRPIKPKPEDEATAVDPLPLGERVHQEAVAGELFPAEASKSQSDIGGKKPLKVEAPKARHKISLPRENMFERAAEPKSRAPLAAVLLTLAAAAAVAAWFYLGQREGPPNPPENAAKDAPKPEQPPPPAEAKPVPTAKPVPPPEKPAEPPAQTGLTADQVRKKLDENKGALQSCIDDALKRDPNLRVGKIHIATTIAPSGQVTTAKIDKRTVNDSPLGSCLRRATTRIAFPAFAGEPFDVDIPIVVTAGD
jgi:hypothetical protein